jgi:hypothetical protein
MGNVSYDESLSFGTLSLVGSVVEFPDIINLGKTDADRKTVDIFLGADPAGGTVVAVTVQGNVTNASTGWVAVGINTFAVADLKAGKCAVAVSPNKYQFLKVTVAKTGTFTAGSLGAQLNTYTGK